MSRRLRVIAGTAGGLLLAAPRGGKVRPTTDRVKESVFGALGADRIDGRAVLDLFAGTGTLAIESLSRGASRAVLVDRDRLAADACRRNLATTGLADRARVQCSPVVSFLGAGPPADAPFGLVFLDPPYETPVGEVARAAAALATTGWLDESASVVLERGATGDGPVWPPGWSSGWERRYGDTLVTILTAAGMGPAA